ncbi:MAG: galactitol 2-dehydrogenase [Pseudonocardiales bacterium]|jgi:NAD(P)-dependent dehydrogenase (short-subunit alcohol dehydrogenase family)|nr:galactitol 2-dehydrogenase [Pseudonocardiales bacterium]
MLGDLEGKRALVSGAAKGIGLAIAKRLAAGGARVVLTDLDHTGVVAAAADLGGGALGLRCDVRSTADVEAATEAAVLALGGLDILVNNAGIEVAAPLLETAETDFALLFDVNVIGVWRCTRAAARTLIDNRGNIVNIASAVGFGSVPLLGAYSASMAAILRVTESIAHELRDAGVRVNAVCPAFVDTSMVERFMGPFEGLAGATGLSWEQLVKMKQSRLGLPEDVAETVAFLASEDSSWTTGSAFTLDGGQTGSLV